MKKTTFIELSKPEGIEPFSRAILNDNSDNLDKQFLAMAFIASCYGPVTKGPIVFVNSKPQSQSISGPNGLTGSIIWSFTSTTITETLSIIAPIALSVTKTITLSNLSETWTVS